jgi:hypothetical protein
LSVSVRKQTLRVRCIKSTGGQGMFSRARTAHSFVLGCAVLGLAMPSFLVAQQGSLPDAPSAVKTTESSAAAAFQQWQLAFNVEPIPQQSLYRPGKQSSAQGYSSSISEVRPVPGAGPVLHNPCPANSCSQAQDILCCGRAPSPFVRYLKSPEAIPLTAHDNLRSAVKNIIDPFNLLTIAGDSAITVWTDSRSPYGAGVEGFGKIAGVSFTEDMTGEFFGTFLFPSIMHQDPHYHREPFASVKKRILHAFTQVVWAQSYTGRPMFNYGNILGGIATAAVSNTFVPGPGRQGFSNTSQRLAIAFAISPSGNLIEEFVPDIASRINLRVVIFQRILNTVSLEESGVQ